MSAALIAVLESIRDESGTLSPRLVVDAARDPQHVLHNRFEWDDSIAGEKYRISQARELLHVTFKPDPSQPTHLRAYVAIKGDSLQSSYVPTESAMLDPFQRTLVLRRMEREWKAFRARYRGMAEFAALIQHDMQGEEAS
jgi:hypothetical protein